MTSDLHALRRERQQGGAALDCGVSADDDATWERLPQLDQVIREARPTNPAGLAIKMRVLADEFAAGGHCADEKLALRIAAALEKLGQACQHGKPTSSADLVQVASDGIAVPA